jgi:hypothetical protein
MAIVKAKIKKPVESVFSAHLPLTGHKQLAELAHRNGRSVRKECWQAIKAHLIANGFDAGEKAAK